MRKFNTGFKNVGCVVEKQKESIKAKK